MPFRLPPSYTPSCHLSNCLSAAASSHVAAPHLSLLAESSAHLISEEPIRGSPDPSSIHVTTPAATAHALGPCGVFVHAGRTSVTVGRAADPGAAAVWSTPLTFSPCAAAAAGGSSGPPIAIVAGCDGAWLFGRSDAPPARLPGTRGHSCVAVDASATGHIACATVSGRVAVWERVAAIGDDDAEPAKGVGGERAADGIAEGGESADDYEFVPCAVFDPLPDYAQTDRVTQVLFSPVAPEATASVLSVAWWSGRVVCYSLDESGRWLRRWSHRAPPDPHDPYGSAPGTYLTYSADASVLAVAAGHGLLQFLAVECGVLVSAFRVLPDRPKSLVTHVKGLASLQTESQRDTAVAVVRGLARFAEIAFPSAAVVQKRVRDDGTRKELELKSKGGRVLFSSEEVTVRASSVSGFLELELRFAKKPKKCSLPLGATDIVLSQPPKDEASMQPRRIYASGMFCNASYLAVIVKTFILVNDMKKGKWSAIVPHSETLSCAISCRGSGNVNSHVPEPSTPNTDSGDDMLLCVTSDGLRAHRWSLKTLVPLDGEENRIEFPAAATSVIGCLSNSGYFATMCRPAEKPITICFIPPEQREIRRVQLPREAEPAGTSADENAVSRLSAMWCSSTSAVFALSAVATIGRGGTPCVLVAVEFTDDDCGTARVTSYAAIQALTKLPRSLKSALAIAESGLRRTEGAKELPASELSQTPS